MDEADESPRSLTPTELRELEERTGVRHELIDGVPHAMSGGSPEHSRIKTNLVAAMVDALRGSDCRVADSDQRLHVEMTGGSFYADLSVVCGLFSYAEDDDYAVTNPSIIVEVVSPGTEAHDRGTKFEHYRRIPTLNQCVLVSQDERRIEVRRRVGSSWILEEHTGGVLELEPDLSIPFDEIYDLTNLRPDPG